MKILVKITAPATMENQVVRLEVSEAVEKGDAIEFKVEGVVQAVLPG